MLYSGTFLRKSRRSCSNVDKMCKAGEAADDNITRHMRCACRVTKSVNTHSEYVVSTAVPRKRGYTNAPQYCVTRPLLLLCHCFHFFGVSVTTFALIWVIGYYIRNWLDLYCHYPRGASNTKRVNHISS
jgi:hypothetical protein